MRQLKVNKLLLVNKDKLEQMSQLIYLEMNSQLPAKKTAVDSLCSYLFIVVLREVLENNEQLSRLLTIKDEKIIKLINAIIQEPSSHWTLESMSEYCLLSRSVFAKRFREHVGYTPNPFLLKIRVDIAMSFRFQSESYFSKAFKMQRGFKPIEYRKI